MTRHWLTAAAAIAHSVARVRHPGHLNRLLADLNDCWTKKASPK